jgi:ubiquinone biosynthesis protein COQ9|tara:strand:- start:217 stop:873 length:657 start_codon:yes stop_codon:yes gene_type:complete
MNKLDKLLITRDRILVATFAHIAFDGCSFRAIEAGATDSGKKLGWGPEMARIAFPNGFNDLVNHLADWSNRMMLIELEKIDLNSMRIRDRIIMIIRLRLQILAPYREGVRRLISYLALPQNTLHATKLTWIVVDDIWYAAGDRSSDYNYYTKRGLLASVYTTTILYWLVDDSEDFIDTWSYIDRRIENIMKIPLVTSGIKRAFNFLPSLLYTQFNIKT